jgi:hypothetical protein
MDFEWDEAKASDNAFTFTFGLTELMSIADRTVKVTLQLPEDVYQKVAKTAEEEHRPPEDLLSALVAEGLDSHISLREVFERLSDQYLDRLRREGQSPASPEETLEDLRSLRERIAHELYP